MGRGVAARPGAERVRLVDHEQRPGPARQLAQPLVEARLGQDDADVRQRRLGEHAGDVAGRERGFERVEIVELDDLRRQRRVDRRADVAGADADRAVLPQRRERLVDGAVVAAVEDEDLRPARDRAADPDREAVRVGRAERELPEREPEAARELLPGPGRILGRQHRGDPGGRPLGDRADDRLGRVPGHRTGVAEAEVDVLVAVDVDDARALRLGQEERVRAGPAHHPRHRDAAQQRSPGPLRERPRTRACRGEGLRLPCRQRRKPTAVDADAGVEHFGRHASFTATCLMRVYSSIE